MDRGSITPRTGRGGKRPRFTIRDIHPKWLRRPALIVVALGYLLLCASLGLVAVGVAFFDSFGAATEEFFDSLRRQFRDVPSTFVAIKAAWDREAA